MRVENWPRVLADALESADRTEFEWGKADCVLWSGSIVAALTGSDPFAAYRNRYETEIGAGRILSRDFGGDLRNVWTHFFGDPAPVAMLGRGDVALVEIDGRTACGVVDSSGERVACLGLDGLEHVPLSAIVAGWKI